MEPALVSDASRLDAVDRLSGALASSGFPRMPARVFAALLFEDSGRLTAAELQDRLTISAAAVSGAARYLVQLGLARRERPIGTRRDVFVVEDDAWHGVLLQTDQLYAPLVAAMHHGSVALDGTAAGDRAALSLEFLQFIEHEMAQLAQRWEAHKAAYLAGRPPAAGRAAHAADR